MLFSNLPPEILAQLKTQMVEVTIPVGQSTQNIFNFVDQAQLRGKKIFGIESYNVLDCPVSPGGVTVVSAALFSRSYVTLFVGPNWQNMAETIKQYPLTSLHRCVSTDGSTNSPYVREILQLNHTIDWAKCSITTGSAAGVDNNSFLFNVYYI